MPLCVGWGVVMPLPPVGVGVVVGVVVVGESGGTPQLRSTQYDWPDFSLHAVPTDGLYTVSKSETEMAHDEAMAAQVSLAEAMIQPEQSDAVLESAVDGGSTRYAEARRPSRAAPVSE